MDGLVEVGAGIKLIERYHFLSGAPRKSFVRSAQCQMTVHAGVYAGVEAERRGAEESARLVGEGDDGSEPSLPHCLSFGRS